MSTTAIGGLTLLAAVTAIVAIHGETYRRQRQVYVAKPLTTTLIILLALLAGGAGAYRWLIVAGLVFCLGGDTFLMLPQRYFVAGLAAFLVGHLLYIAAFVSDAGLTLTLSPWLGLLLVYGGIVYGLLHPHLGRLRRPVILYVLAILVMAWQAVGRWQAVGGTGPLLAAAGALFFVVSDTALALDRFRRPFRGARILVLGTYWLAQWLIALSLT